MNVALSPCEQGEKESQGSGIINPDDLVLYSVSLIKSLHRLIMC